MSLALLCRSYGEFPWDRKCEHLKFFAANGHMVTHLKTVSENTPAYNGCDSFIWLLCSVDLVW